MKNTALTLMVMSTVWSAPTLQAAPPQPAITGTASRTVLDQRVNPGSADIQPVTPTPDPGLIDCSDKMRMQYIPTELDGIDIDVLRAADQTLADTLALLNQATAPADAALDQRLSDNSLRLSEIILKLCEQGHCDGMLNQ